MNTQNIRRAISAAMAALRLRSAQYLECRYARNGIRVLLDGAVLGFYNTGTGEFVKALPSQ